VPRSGGLGVQSTGVNRDTYRMHLPLSSGARCGESCRPEHFKALSPVSQSRAGLTTSRPSANVLSARSRAHSVWTWDVRKLSDGQRLPSAGPEGSTSRPCWYGKLSAGPTVFHQVRTASSSWARLSPRASPSSPMGSNPLASRYSSLLLRGERRLS
jgi:hypothetical protein